MEADVTLGAFPGRQKVRVQRLSCVTQREMHGVFWRSSKEASGSGIHLHPKLTAPVHPVTPVVRRTVCAARPFTYQIDRWIDRNDGLSKVERK